MESVQSVCEGASYSATTIIAVVGVVALTSFFKGFFGALLRDLKKTR